MTSLIVDMELRTEVCLAVAHGCRPTFRLGIDAFAPQTGKTPFSALGQGVLSNELPRHRPRGCLTADA